MELELKNIFANHTIAPSNANSLPRYSVAKVTGVNEYENTCDILFISSGSSKKPINNVEVSCLYDDSWFPDLEQYVRVMDVSDTPIIIGPANRNYIKDIRPSHFDELDIMAYSACGPGGNIND